MDSKREREIGKRANMDRKRDSKGTTMTPKTAEGTFMAETVKEDLTEIIRDSLWDREHTAERDRMESKDHKMDRMEFMAEMVKVMDQSVK